MCGRWHLEMRFLRHSMHRSRMMSASLRTHVVYFIAPVRATCDLLCENNSYFINFLNTCEITVHCKWYSVSEGNANIWTPDHLHKYLCLTTNRYWQFRFINLLYLQLTSLELQYVSPKLLMCRDMELAVPGTYDPNQPIIKISHIQSSLQVITSKQRPRKLSVFGKQTEIAYKRDEMFQKSWFKILL